MKKIQELYTKYKEIIMYLIFGVGTTAVNWLIYTVIVVVGKEVNLTIANMIAWVGAVAFAYITNKLWVFESKSWNPKIVWKELGMFLGARIFSGAFEIALFPVLVWMGMNQSIFGVEGMLAKIVIGVLVVILNYVFSKLLIFKKKKVQ